MKSINEDDKFLEINYYYNKLLEARRPYQMNAKIVINIFYLIFFLFLSNFPFFDLYKNTSRFKQKCDFLQILTNNKKV